MRYLTIILLLLTACSSPGLINYTEQPGTTCAPPIGKWTRTPTICVDDSVVYLSEGGFADSSLVQGIADPVAREFVNYTHAIEPAVNAHFIGNIEVADIPVRLYDGSSSKFNNGLYGCFSEKSGSFSYKATADMSELEKWLILIGVTAIVANADIHGGTVGFDVTGTSPETETAVMNMLNRQPPPANSGYNGLCYYTHRGDKLTATSVWINVGGIPNRQYALAYFEHVLRHELGHAVIGLNDNLPDSWNPPDGVPDGPGLMSYTGRMPDGWFSNDELLTIRWLYGGQ